MDHLQFSSQCIPVAELYLMELLSEALFRLVSFLISVIVYGRFEEVCS